MKLLICFVRPGQQLRSCRPHFSLPGGGVGGGGVGSGGGGGGVGVVVVVNDNILHINNSSNGCHYGPIF